MNKGRLLARSCTTYTILQSSQRQKFRMTLSSKVVVNQEAARKRTKIAIKAALENLSILEVATTPARNMVAQRKNGLR